MKVKIWNVPAKKRLWKGTRWRKEGFEGFYLTWEDIKISIKLLK